jgi:hypothetical protein
MKISLYDQFEDAFPVRRFDEGFFDRSTLAYIKAFDSAGGNSLQRENIVNDWIASGQPCTFAHYAYRKGLLEVIVHDDSVFPERREDIIAGIRGKIEKWKDRYRDGKTVGFFLCFTGARFVPMPRSIKAADFIRELSESIFQVEAAMNKPVFFDVFSSGGERAAAESLPINFFCTQGAGSNWRNRHFPGGIAFSVNSGEQLARLVSKTNGRCPIQLSKFYESHARATLNSAEDCDLTGSVGDELEFACNFDPDVMLPSDWFSDNEKQDRSGRPVKSVYRFSEAAERSL